MTTTTARTLKRHEKGDKSAEMCSIHDILQHAQIWREAR